MYVSGRLASSAIQAHAPWRQPGKNDQAGSDHGQQRGVARELGAAQ